MAGRGFPEDFTIQVCREGEPWRVIVDKRAYPEPLRGEAQSFACGQAEGRYVKVEATRLREVEPGSHRFQLAEISVFGEPVTGTPLKGKSTELAGPTTVGRLRCENRDDALQVERWRGHVHDDEWRGRDSGARLVRCKRAATMPS